MVKVFMRRNSTTVSSEQCVSAKAKAVLQLLRRNGPLTLKQLEYCDEACIARFLKSNGNHVKRAAKQLKATLAWRANLDVDYLTADEFSAELLEGSAFVAGQDDEGRPVLIVRMKPEHLTNRYQKRFLRYVVFTMEVAIACMPSEINQSILILDAGCLRRGSPGLSMIVHLLKMIDDHYPERVATTFVVDAPSIFYYVWKGISAFLDPGMREKLRFVFSRNYNAVASHLIKGARSYANRNLWSEHSDYEENDKFDFNTPVRENVTQTISQLSDRFSSSSFRLSSGAALVSDKKQARSLSFASLATRGWTREAGAVEFRSFRKDPVPLRSQEVTQCAWQDGSRRWVDLPSTFESSKEQQQLDYSSPKGKERTIDLFRPYVNFTRFTYNEAAYRAKMKPPLGGLISIISPELKREPSFSLADREAVLPSRVNLR